ncbi:MAG: hypothetical protein RID53_14865 [Coleofasciculus sp. B1-GNL1-01]|uniref:hypothetical protein n=1 Tax=Coleofasciculus sp. B1-GNL1-01 TaxID=3068484 RepID=UPI0032FAC993
MVTSETRQLNDIATWMRQDRETDLPDILQGVFFMDGNPLADDCCTLEGGQWNANSRTLFLPVFAPFQWTFQVSEQGRQLLNFVNFAKVTYKFEFDPTFRYAIIIPIVFGLSIPTWLVEFSMIQMDNDMQGNTWKRKNSWLLGLSDTGEYTFRKIVDKNRQYTLIFYEVQPKISRELLVITKNE